MTFKEAEPKGPKKVQGTLKIVTIKARNLPKDNGRLPSPYLVIKRDWYSINNTDLQYEVKSTFGMLITRVVDERHGKPRMDSKSR